jgi:hypothetical protein
VLSFLLGPCRVYIMAVCLQLSEISWIHICTVKYRAQNHGDWRIRIVELGQHSKVMKEEKTRRLRSDLKGYFLF